MNSAAPRIAVLPASAAWRTLDFISDLHLQAGEPHALMALEDSSALLTIRLTGL